MKSAKQSLVVPVPIGLIPNIRSYWATHFYSVLQCMDAHKNFEYSPRRFDGFPVYSLGALRGQFPLNFFNQIESYMRNWGVQYFLVNFFNQKLGAEIIEKLILNIEELYAVKFSRGLEYFSFHVSGSDSSLSADLSGFFSEVFPRAVDGLAVSPDLLIAYSDICLVLANQETGVKVGIFGEVEGIYGNKLRNESYWKRKQDLCVFGIGVVDGDQKLVYFENTCFNGVCKVNLFFERSNFVVSDFGVVLGIFKMLFLNGPQTDLNISDEELGFFVDLVKKSWSKNISELMANLRQYLSYDDVVGFNLDGLSIVADLQSAPKR